MKRNTGKWKSFLFSSFWPEFMNTWSREVPLPTSDGDAATGINGQARSHNHGSRKPGEVGETVQVSSSLSSQNEVAFFPSIFLNPLIDSWPHPHPAPRTPVCSSQIPSSPPALLSQHHAQGSSIFSWPHPSRELPSPTPLTPWYTSTSHHPTLAPLSSGSYPAVVRMGGNELIWENRIQGGLQYIKTFHSFCPRFQREHGVLKKKKKKMCRVGWGKEGWRKGRFEKLDFGFMYWKFCLCTSWGNVSAWSKYCLELSMKLLPYVVGLESYPPPSLYPLPPFLPPPCWFT